MKKSLFLFIIFLLFFGCSDVKPPKENKDSPFRTTVPSQIYFKNMRSLHYTETDTKQEGVKRFEPKSIEKNAIRPKVFPIIYQNWLKDEAYIVFEKLDAPKESLSVELNIGASEESSKFQLGNFKSHFDLAQKIYQNPSNFQLYIYENEEKRKILKESKDALIVLSDYFKLLE